MRLWRRVPVLLLCFAASACSGRESGDVGDAPSGGSAPTGGTGNGTSGSGSGSAGESASGGSEANLGGGGASGGEPNTAGSAGAVGSAGTASSESCQQLLTKTGDSSQWVHYDEAGKLTYADLDASHNRILDYSHAGYRGGGVKLPEPAQQAQVAPSGGDDTSAIQKAIDSVSVLPLKAGARGAVVLAPGSFKLAGTLTIKASGVVLRGAGSDAKTGTRLELTGEPHQAITVAGSGSWKAEGSSQAVTDAYVPSGSRELHVADGSAFKAGDTVLVERPVTQAWVHLMGMDTLVRNGQPQTWLGVGSTLRVDRQVAEVKDNVLTLDVPLADSYDAKYLSPPGPSVVRYSFAGRITEVGVEHLRVVAPDTSTAISQAQFQVLSVDAAADSWVRDVAAENTVNSLSVGATCKRITVEDFDFSRTSVADGSAGYPLEITLEGTQTLVQRSQVVGANVYTFATGGRVPGPNVYLNCSGSGAHNRAEPHMRWATGLLTDNVTEEDQINYVNRATAGSGHGWAIGWGVIWNSKAGSFKVEQPPGSQNYCIGCTGKQTASDTPGAFELANSRASLDSLYLAQLCERLGPSALHAIGY